jgi:biopolymer transport protein ExbD
MPNRPPSTPILVSRGQIKTYKEAARRRRRHRAQPLNINLTPMIDVTFLLLLFFSVTTTFKRAEGYLPAKLPTGAGRSAVARPAGATRPAVDLPVNPIVVHVQQFGPGRADYRLRLDHFVNTPATFSELTQVLQQIHGNPGFSTDTPVIIAAEPDVAWDHVVNCWNSTVAAGCKNIAFGGN